MEPVSLARLLGADACFARVTLKHAALVLSFDNARCEMSSDDFGNVVRSECAVALF